MSIEINWQQTYNAAMDSVNLLNAGKPPYDSESDWAGSVQRNVGHLKIILQKDWPEGFDLTPFQNAVR
jgi:hypothetical protein